MFHDHDRSTFDDAAPISTTTTERRAFDLQLKHELSLALPRAGLGGIVGDILRVLIQLYNPDDGFAWPCEDRIGFLIGKDERTVRYHWKKVEASKLFTKVRGRQHVSNRYVPNWAMIDKLVPADRKGFTGMMRAYDAMKATGDVRKLKSDRKRTKASGISDHNQRQDVPEASGISDRQTGQNSFSDRKDLVIQTGEELPATSLMNLSHQSTLMEGQNARASADAPAPAARAQNEVSGEKLTGFDAPDWDDEYREFVGRFPGNPMGDRYQGWFAGIRRRGFTLDDVLIALEHDAKVGNPDGTPRTIASFFGAYFGESAKPEDVQNWRKALAEARSKAAHAAAMRYARPAARKVVAKVAAGERVKAEVKVEAPMVDRVPRPSMQIEEEAPDDRPEVRDGTVYGEPPADAVFDDDWP